MTELDSDKPKVNRLRFERKTGWEETDMHRNECTAARRVGSTGITTDFGRADCQGRRFFQYFGQYPESLLRGALVHSFRKVIFSICLRSEICLVLEWTVQSNSALDVLFALRAPTGLMNLAKCRAHDCQETHISIPHFNKQKFLNMIRSVGKALNRQNYTNVTRFSLTIWEADFILTYLR